MSSVPASFLKHRCRAFPTPRPLRRRNPTQIVTVYGRGNNINGAADSVGVTKTLTRCNHQILVISFSPRNTTAINLNVGTGAIRDAVCATLFSVSISPRSIIRRATFSGVSIVPTGVSLSTTRIRLIARINQRRVLGNILHGLGTRCSIVVISYRPSLNLLAIGTLTTTSNIVVPITTRFFTLHNITLLVRSVRGIRSHVGPTLRICNILIAVCAGALRYRRMYRHVCRTFRGGIFRAFVSQSVGLPSSDITTTPVIVCTPKRGATGRCHRITHRLISHNVIT